MSCDSKGVFIQFATTFANLVQFFDQALCYVELLGYFVQVWNVLRTWKKPTTKCCKIDTSDRIMKTLGGRISSSARTAAVGVGIRCWMHCIVTDTARPAFPLSTHTHTHTHTNPQPHRLHIYTKRWILFRYSLSFFHIYIYTAAHTAPMDTRLEKASFSCEPLLCAGVCRRKVMWQQIRIALCKRPMIYGSKQNSSKKLILKMFI